MKDPYPSQKTGRVLITGCPRSGTKFVKRYFEAQHRIFLGHEQEGQHGTVDWRQAYTRSPAFEATISLVRHPIPTIRSLTDLMIAYSRRKGSIEWHRLRMVAVAGGWLHLLSEEMWVEAATQWWYTVYEHHRKQDWLQLRIEDFRYDQNVPDVHPKPCALNIDKDWCWHTVKPLAEELGYTRSNMLS